MCVCVHMRVYACACVQAGPCSAPAPLRAQTADVKREDVLLSRLAFGSCNKALSPQRVWGAVRAKAPQMWLWAGDAVYLGGDQPGNLEEAFEAQGQQVGYRQLLSDNIIVDGVYDDHDYGGNDAGKHFASRAQSQQLFLDFIGVPGDSPRRTRKGTDDLLTIRRRMST